MASRQRLQRVRVTIGGQPEQDVLKLKFDTLMGTDFKGAPDGEPLFRRIKLTTRVARGPNEAVSWAHNLPRQPHNLKNGKIEFFDRDGEHYKTLEWIDGFVENAKWILPDTAKEEQHFFMEYEIVARKIEIDGVELVNPWEEQ